VCQTDRQTDASTMAKIRKALHAVARKNQASKAQTCVLEQF